jgi:hypothetical protein
MLSELNSLNVNLCGKQYNKIDLLHLIVVPQLSSGWRHNYSTKTRNVGRAIEQSMYHDIHFILLNVTTAFTKAIFQLFNQLLLIVIVYLIILCF